MRRVLAIAEAVLLVLSLAGGTTALAAGIGSQPVTRAEFCELLAKADGLAPVTSTTPTFSDVPPSNPYYGYVEAVYRAGWASGTGTGVFDPNGSLTREQVAKIEVLALGEGQAAQAMVTAPIAFKDNGTISAWALGYINEAVKLGLISGYPDGTFRATQPLTSADVGYFLKKFVAVKAAPAYQVSVKLSASDVPVGQMVSLSASVVDGQGTPVGSPPVTFSVDSPKAIVAGSTFIASAPGIYTLTATYSVDGRTYTGTTQVTVCGPPAGLVIAVPSPPVANGYTQVQVRVKVVDAQGNLVVNDTGTQITLGNVGAAVAMTGTMIQTTLDGIATFTMTGGTVPGVESVLTATDTAIHSSGGTVATQISSVPQIPTSVAITGPTEITANGAGTTATLQVQLLDQAGQPILNGTYALTASVSGAGTFIGGSTTPETVVYTGNGLGDNKAPHATVTVQDIQSETGPITVDVGGHGITSASATVQAVIGGVPNHITVTAPNQVSVSRDTMATAGVTFTISATDVAGLVSTVNAPVLIAVYDSSGQIAQNILVDGQAQTSIPGGYTDTAALQNGHFTLTDTSSSSDVGTYTVQVSSPTGGLSSASPATLTVVAGSAAGVFASLASTGLPITAPETTITVQVVDAFGNPVKQSGIPVTLTSAPTNKYPLTFGPASGVTNAQGVFTATVQAPVNAGQFYTVDVTATVDGVNKAAFPEPVFVVGIE